MGCNCSFHAHYSTSYGQSIFLFQRGRSNLLQVERTQYEKGLFFKVSGTDDASKRKLTSHDSIGPMVGCWHSVCGFSVTSMHVKVEAKRFASGLSGGLHFRTLNGRIVPSKSYCRFIFTSLYKRVCNRGPLNHVLEQSES